MKQNIRPEYEPAEFCAAMNEVATIRPGEIPEMFDEVKRIIREGIADNFAKQQTADGIGWPPRKIIGDGHPLLQDTLALRNAALGEGPGTVERVVGGDELQLGVEKIQLGGLPGAAVHQYGYPEKNIPQREYLAMSEETIDKTVDAVADYLIERVL